MRKNHPLLAAAAAGAAMLGLLAFGAATADAGIYRAAQCHPDLGAGHAGVSFRRSSDHYRSAADCRPGGTGLAVTHEARSSAGGRWGAWTLQAPSGTQIVRARARVRGAQQGGHAPELLVGTLPGSLLRFASATPTPRTASWVGAGARIVSARLRCTRGAGCGPGRAAELRLRRLVLSLRDFVRPTIGLGGPLLQPGSRRGMESLRVLAADAGGGIRRVLAEVNGEPLDARGLQCSLASGVALRLSPCPLRSEAELWASTGRAPFRQGPNEIRVCALDHATGTNANRACESRRLRVDNACPLSPVPGSRLLTAFEGDGRTATVIRGETVIVIGRLLDSAGSGVAGARVCVATRARIAGAPERVIATPLTAADGRFAARIPTGPSRAVRIAHWPHERGALERFLDLRVRARPSLRILPDRTLHNGDRARFRVLLHGPRQAGREVRLKVWTAGRWLTLRAGRANDRGIWRAGYRFHATSGRRTYRFRAFVPRQAGYPYRAGRSRAGRVTVEGR